MRDAHVYFRAGIPTLLAMLLLAACSTPLGPGYKVEREQIEVHCRPGPPPAVDVAERFRIRNIGNAPLESLEFRLAAELLPADAPVTAQADGHPATVERTEKTLRVVLQPAWKMKSRHELSLAYHFGDAPAAHVYVSARGDEFLLLGEGWLAQPLRPRGTFAKGGERPANAALRVRAPAGLRVAAAGHGFGTFGVGGETELRGTLAREDRAPYVIAGAYQERRISEPGPDLVVWSASPISAGEAQQIGLRLSHTWQAAARAFGGLPAPMEAVRVVATRLPLSSAAAPEGARIAAFAGGVAVEAAPAGLASEAFLHRAERELAQSWFGYELRPTEGFEILMGGAAREYAATLGELASNGGGSAARQREIARLIGQFDRAQHALGEQNAGQRNPKPADCTVYSWQPQNGPLAKEMVTAHAALFYFALEDRIGEASLHRGLAHLISSFGGGTAGANELRSVLELESHQDLAVFFRNWLAEPGLPSDFRAKYEPTGETPGP
jgi:hypothetical protein